VIPARLSGPSEGKSVGARFAFEVGASVLADTPCRQLRGQASLLRPAARIKGFAGKPRKRPAARIKSAQHQGSASAKGVGALRGYEGSDGLRSGPNTSGPGFSDTPRAPFYCRCAPDRGQASLLRPSARIKGLAGKLRNRPAARIKSAPHQGSASAEGVGALRGYEGSDGLRSGPNISGSWFAQTHRVHRFTAAARQIAGKPRSYGLRPESKASRASLAPTAFGQNQKRAAPGIRFCRRRRSSSRLREQRWAAQRPQHLMTLVCSDTPRAPFYCRCAPDRGQASLVW